MTQRLHDIESTTNQKETVEFYWVLVEKRGHDGFYNMLLTPTEIEEIWRVWNEIKKKREAKQ